MVDTVAAGNSIVRNPDSLDEALFQYQEHEFRMISGKYQYAKEQAKWTPAMAEEMDEVTRLGVTRSYSPRRPPTNPRRRGLPYRPNGKEEILRELWRDIDKGRMFICGARCDQWGTRRDRRNTIYTGTKT